MEPNIQNKKSSRRNRVLAVLLTAICLIPMAKRCFSHREAPGGETKGEESIPTGEG